MKIYYIVLLFPCLNAVADPFFGEQNTKTDSAAVQSTTSFSNTLCKPSENIIRRTIEQGFEKLKLVGLVTIQDQFRALFIDEKEQLIVLKEKELINNKIEIKMIDLKSITYINWQVTQHCENPEEIILKL